MMKRFPNLTFAALLAILLAVGSIQAYRLSHIREAEKFYRWIQAQATQYRVFSDAPPATDETKDMMDEPLFAKILDWTDGAIDSPAPMDDKGKPMRKLVALVRDAKPDNNNDKLIWDMVAGNAMAPLRKEFLTYLRDKKLLNVASSFNAQEVYAQQDTSVNIGNIFFGFRKLAANFVWMQVDRYWHAGHLQRMIPLMKTCVTLDPQFVDAYLLGAWHLAYNVTAKMDDTPEELKKYYPKYKVRIGEKELYYYNAIDFLKDGIRKNPRNYKLYFDAGFSIYKMKLNDYPNAVLYLSEALRYRHDKWVPRQLYVCYELNKQYDEALAGWQDYAAKNPDNTVAPRFIKRNQGLIKERDAAKAEEMAAKAATPEEAAKYRAEAEALLAEAQKIYEEMNPPGTEEEPFALGRLMRMKAVKYMREGRYIEAIAVLENARQKSNEVFWEASDMMIDAKNKAGIPLSLSEKKAVLRKETEERIKQKAAQDAAQNAAQGK